MSKITLDAELRAKLNGLADQLEVCDETGNTVGHFVPEELYRDLLQSWAKNEFTDAEIEQARQEVKAEGGLTTSEAIAYIQERIAAEPEGAS